MDMSINQARTLRATSCIQRLGRRMPGYLEQAAAILSGSGAAALMLLGRQVPSHQLLPFCIAVSLLMFFIAKLVQETRHRRDERLLTLLAETRQQYNSVASGLVLCSEEGVITDINDTLLEDTCRQRHDLVGKRSINDILSSASRKKFWEFVAMSKRNVGWVRNITLEFMTGLNTGKSLLANICYEMDGSGTASIICSTADVAEVREIETLLAETRTVFRRFCEQLENIGVIRCDFDGKINFSNSNACLILLRHRMDLLGKNTSQLYSQEESALFRQDMKAAHDSPDRKYAVTRRLLRADNSSFLAKVSIIPARTEFGSNGAIIILEDLSDKTIRDSWLANVMSNRESTMHLGRCLADMIENLCEVLYVHQPKFTNRPIECRQDIPTELSEMAQLFSNKQVFAELLNFSVSTLRLLIHQLNKSLAARDMDNVLMIAALIESIGMKLKLKKIEQSCLDLQNEAGSEAWQQIELCAAVVKKEVDSVQIAADAVLDKKEPQYAKP